MASHIELPTSTNTVRVRMFDTTTKLSTAAECFVEPVHPGHETLNLTSVGFLIENERLDRRAVYDLGCKKEFRKSPPSLVSRMERILAGIRVDKDASEVLEEAGLDLESIDTVIWSHAHFDHMGDITLFPVTTKLVVGPRFSSTFLPAYPEDPNSRIDGHFFKGRELEEVDMDEAEAQGRRLSIADFDSIDYFGDGSFYLLSAPGHLDGHVCGLARTTPDTFVFMGGDVAHFPGLVRPTEFVPLPDFVPKTANLDSRFYKNPCPCSAFDHLRSGQDSDADGIGDPQHRQRPFYHVTRSEHSAYVERDRAIQDIKKVQRLDADPNVLICLAHDPALLEVLPTLNDDPGQEINVWKEKGWKEQCQWRFLKELPRADGERGSPMHVKGIWVGEPRKLVDKIS